MVSPSIVRITFVRKDVRDDIEEEQRVSGHVDFDIVQLIEINRMINEGLGTPLEQPGDVPAPHRPGRRVFTH